MIDWSNSPTLTTVGETPSTFVPVAATPEILPIWPPTPTERHEARLADIEARLAGALARMDRESADTLAALTQLAGMLCQHDKGLAILEGIVDAQFALIERVRKLEEKQGQQGDGK